MTVERNKSTLHLHDADVVGEGSDPQPFDHDVRQVVRVQHQVLPAVLQQLLVIVPLVLLHVPDCHWKHAVF